jgi:hypothetical protein
MPGSQLSTTIRAVPRRSPLLLALAVLAGCGGGSDAPAPPPPTSKAKVALLAAPQRAGEVIVRADLSPASKGPFAFDGRYLVRFEQFAPEDPKLDFTGQTSFVADLDRRAEIVGAGSIHLFDAAQRTGRRTVTLRGRWYVDVSFGDFPFVIRFTPVS